MAIVKMKKFRLFALEKDRKPLLKELQKFDYVHFIKTSNEENEDLKEIQIPENINLIKEKSQKVKWMINYLSKLFPKEAKEEISNSSIGNLLFVQVEQQADKYDFNKDYETLDRISKEIEANKEEFIRDTDGDGIPDAVERNQGTNPYSPDSDGDGKSDHEEYSFGSNPIDNNHPKKTEKIQSPSEIINYKDTKELNKVLKDGIKEYFESDTYKEYLTTMSKFHHYSPRNIELILKQNPHATKVASYSKWLENFGRKVNEGEKPLRILAPVPLKKRDPITKEPILDKDGNEQVFTSYKFVSVFDISQTSGRELPKPAYELEGSFEDYAILYKSMKEISKRNGIPIRFEDIGDGSSGYYSRQYNEIVIQKGMSEQQTLKTIIHEIAHSELHTVDKLLEIPLSRSTRELQAESVSFVVSNHYGLDTSNYTFAYLASWTEDKEGLKDLEEQVNIVQKEAESLITRIDKAIVKSKTKALSNNSFEEKISRFKSEKMVKSEHKKEKLKKEQLSDKEAGL